MAKSSHLTRRERKKAQFARYPLSSPEALPTQKDVIVIGAGASGLMAAIYAARAGKQVLIIERDKTPGHSVLITGDGRCNIANEGARAHHYYSSRFVSQAFLEESPDHMLVEWEYLGLMLREEADGRLYPLANKSSVVLDVLLRTAQRLRVELLCSCEASRIVEMNAATSIYPGDEGVGAYREQWGVLGTASDSERLIATAESVIVATSAPSAAQILRSFAEIHEPHRILAPLKLSTPVDGFFDALVNTRIKCALYPDFDKRVFSSDSESPSLYEEGEITVRDYGISGIVAFNMSRFVSVGSTLYIDFLPDSGWDRNALIMDADMLKYSNYGPTSELFHATAAWLHAHANETDAQTYAEVLEGVVLPEVAHMVCQAAGLDTHATPDDAGLRILAQYVRAFPLNVEGIGNEKLAQGWRGGVDVCCVDPCTMELKQHSGLYVCGEALDVDGPCGGYNLTWAWVSGIIAGRAAGA